MGTEREQMKDKYVAGAKDSLEEAKKGMKGLSFGDVIPILQAAGKVTRLAWKTDQMHIDVQDHEISAVYADGAVEMWQPTTEDLFATDWKELK